MDHLPFDKPGRFWRGNLHTHSTCSDGKLTPEQICNLYRESGYHFLSITDHFTQTFNYPITDTRPFRDENFTTIIGAELHVNKTEFGRLWHFLCVGLPFDFAPLQEDETPQGLAARAMEAGAYVAIAHPAWYNLTENDVLSIDQVDAIEIYNGVSADFNDRADSGYMLDLMLERGRRYFACATDDAHFNPLRYEAMRGWVWVKSEELTPEGLLAGLKAGHSYSSTGPQIHDIQVVPGQKIYVRCSPASRIFVTGSSWETAYTHGNGITEAELSLEKFNSPYCRVTVRDPHGEKAWSNPIWF